MGENAGRVLAGGLHVAALQRNKDQTGERLGSEAGLLQFLADGGGALECVACAGQVAVEQLSVAFIEEGPGLTGAVADAGCQGVRGLREFQGAGRIALDAGDRAEVDQRVGLLNRIANLAGNGERPILIGASGCEIALHAGGPAEVAQGDALGEAIATLVHDGISLLVVVASRAVVAVGEASRIAEIVEGFRFESAVGAEAGDLQSGLKEDAGKGAALLLESDQAHQVESGTLLSLALMLLGDAK